MNKVELHLHFEGAAPPDFIRQLASEKKVNLDGVFDENGHYSYTDFWDFLKVYEAATAVLQTPEDFARLTRAVLKECAAHGVVYAETFLSPDFCGGRDVGAWREYLHAIQEAAEAGEREDGVTLRGIVTCIRHFGPEKARETALCAAETAGDWITGFGLAGDEKAGSPSDYIYSFDMAREARLRLTAHAGEWGGAKSVIDALDALKVERIGHGVQSIDDKATIERLVREDIVLEVCPGSNVALGVYPSWADHPIARLRDAGVKTTISTDDPPFFHTTMTREFDELERAFGWGEAEFAELNANALDAAFCDSETKERIRKRISAT